MSKRKINTILYGCGDMGIQAYNILKHDEKLNVVGFLDDKPNMSSFLGLPILGSLENFDLLKNKHNITHGLVTIGNNKIRKEKTKSLQSEGLEIIIAKHPKSFLDNEKEIGVGTIIEMGSYIHPETVVGNGCFICSGSVLAHNSTIGDFALIAGGVIFGSRVKIGSLSLIGVGANISPYIDIGENVIVGTGSSVIKNLPSNVVAAGVPAKVLRKNNE